MSRRTPVCGVDRFRDHWLVATDLGPGRTRLHRAASFAAILAMPDVSHVIVDVPVGLAIGGRRCDVEARRLLGERRSSVFPAPIRAMFEARDYADACARRAAIEGKKCSKQSFAIMPIVREVDASMTPELQSRVREGHPEVSFAALNGGTPVRHSKRDEAGKQDRLRLLCEHFDDLDERISAYAHRRAVVDILDAYAMLWTARRLREGTAGVLPAEPQYDEKGLRAEMVY
ncbi:MAG: DUF429 domain-containing protein [Gemmatimonadota bacterium]